MNLVPSVKPSTIPVFICTMSLNPADLVRSDSSHVVGTAFARAGVENLTLEGKLVPPSVIFKAIKKSP